MSQHFQTVVLVGLGNVGFPSSSRRQSLLVPNSHYLTHFEAIKEDPSFSLLAAVDSDIKAATRYQEETFEPTFTSIKEVSIRESLSLVVVAASTSSHFEIVKSVLNSWKPKYVLCEKPLGLNAQESVNIREEVTSSGAVLFSGYFRHRFFEYVELRDRILNGYFGRVVEARVLYGQDLLINGCHFIHLLLFLTSSRRIYETKYLSGSIDNPTFIFSSDQIEKVLVIGHDQKKLRVGEIHLYMEFGYVKISNGGSIIESSLNLSSQYRWRDPQSRTLHVDLTKGLSLIYRDIKLHKDGSTANEFSETLVTDQAILTQAIIQSTKEDFSSGIQ